MEVVNFEISLQMPLAGSTGHMNRSRLIVGNLEFPHDRWGKEETDKILPGTSFHLEIPSGILQGTVNVVDEEGEEITFSLDPATAHWAGKRAGLDGGLSGYLWWTWKPTPDTWVLYSWFAPSGCSWEEYIRRTENIKRMEDFGFQYWRPSRPLNEEEEKILSDSSLLTKDEAERIVAAHEKYLKYIQIQRAVQEARSLPIINPLLLFRKSDDTPIGVFSSDSFLVLDEGYELATLESAQFLADSYKEMGS